MEQIKTIILEDEMKLREVLKVKLKSKCPEIDLVGEASSVDDAYTLIQRHKPDLAFLDIALIDETSFDLLERLEEIDFQIIFITSYSEYALRALKVSAVDYLLKPVENDDLIEAVQKVAGLISQQTNSKNYQILKYNLNHINEQNAKIVIPGTDIYKFMKISDIIRFEGWEKYTRVHAVGGTTCLSSYNIGHFAKLVKDFNFYKTHKSHIVNIEHVESYLSEGSVLMSDGDHVPVSRRKKDEFLNHFVR